ncbi:ferrous iron transport protein A [Propionibacterium cyclohexanicum]|uniref:Ferrous iron transport protein A n=1 Tax=Propionibacterium cyclohexanicum TaxID=64702 RepID=A0A1H9SZH6_9ACTN|nr:FeoA family protein [Propionibacterium cyclohexanicum]SER90227.1 ferrous iron transport protein A [Propionibacterium cyclohexanicum]
MASNAELTSQPVVALSGLRSGERAVITEVGGDPSIRHRMHLLGFTRGREVSLVRRAPFNGPMVFRVCDAEMCLREAQARLVSVRRLDLAADQSAA